MKITRISPLTGKSNSMELDITNAQLRAYENGEGLVQDIFPDLMPHEREFIMTGYTSGDWEVMFPPEKNE